jgi:hypothetical protein
MIEDDGIGEENWRIKNSKNSDFDKVESLIEKYKGNVHLINKEEGGVKYCVMFPLAKITSLENLNNVILFPSK